MGSKKSSPLVICICLALMLITLWCANLVEVTGGRQLDAIPYKAAKPLKRIVLWTGFFASRTWYIREWPKGSLDHQISCAQGNRCILTVNTSDPLVHDAVVFHGRNPPSIPSERLPNQVYIIHMWESPVHKGNFIRGAHFYNWTSSYSTKSDVTLRHGTWLKLPKPNLNITKALPHLAKKRASGAAIIAWIVSNCHAPSNRNSYVKDLQKYISVDVYGQCGKRCPKGTNGNSDTCFNQISQSGQYKFYLAFENSACEDYISYKAFRAIDPGMMIPIVLGGLHARDYIGALPPNSYIDVRNFTSTKHLAEYLRAVDADEEKFLAYHAWRTQFKVIKLGNDFCTLCKNLYNQSMTKPRNVDWGDFWNAHKMCDSQLVKKLLTPPYTEQI